MKKTICDRCKKEISPYIAYLNSNQVMPSTIAITISQRHTAMESRQVDLCDDCKADFLSWLNEYESEVKE